MTEVDSGLRVHGKRGRPAEISFALTLSNACVRDRSGSSGLPQDWHEVAANSLTIGSE
jgi:hypothetical protein